MIFQTNPLFAPSIIHAACAFDQVAYYRESRMGIPWRPHEFAEAWHGAVDRGIISGDLNGDGDMDDPGEAVIQNWQDLADHLKLPIKYLGKFPLSAFARFDTPDYWVITAWRWKQTHWVKGIVRPVDWDSIEGGSMTVRNGAPQELDVKAGTGGLRVLEVVR